MQNQIHTVLGAKGAAGKAVAKELQKRKLSTRLVSRNSAREVPEAMTADITDINQAKKAIQGSSYVYLCIGLPYRSSIWLRDWPLIMRNVITACEESNVTLIFLDNVYMYGPVPLSVPFDENHMQHPVTKKGKARKQITDILLEAMKQQRINAVIGRSADFYGEYAQNSPFYISFLERMLQGKPPQFLGKPDTQHTYAYLADNARALVMLALDKSTYGQVWHLPVGEPSTIEAVTAIFNEALGTQFQTQFMPPFLRKSISLISPDLKEVSEMIYQFESDYVMSWKKFKAHFRDFETTSYHEGIQSMIRSFVKD